MRFNSLVLIRMKIYQMLLIKNVDVFEGIINTPEKNRTITILVLDLTVVVSMHNINIVSVKLTRFSLAIPFNVRYVLCNIMNFRHVLCRHYGSLRNHAGTI